MINFKSPKNILWLLLSFLFLYGFITGIYLPYVPNVVVDKIMWYGLYPFLAIIIFYFVYLNKDTKINIHELKKNAKQQGKNKLLVKLIGPIFVVFSPIMVIGILEAYLALGADYFAREKFLQQVLVKDVSCDYSLHRYSRSKLSLSVLDTDLQRFKINFPHELRSNKVHVKKLQWQYITLYGRQWPFGNIYDGFYYQ